MFRAEPQYEGGARAYTWVCLLLAFLFLYNPYLSAHCSGEGLNVQHPASHRATVGSSEMEQFSPRGSQDADVFVAFFFVDVLSFLPDIGSHSFTFPGSELILPPQLLCASLWFRPPPAL